MGAAGPHLRDSDGDLQQLLRHCGSNSPVTAAAAAAAAASAAAAVACNVRKDSHIPLKVVYEFIVTPVEDKQQRTTTTAAAYRDRNHRHSGKGAGDTNRARDSNIERETAT